MIATLPDVLLTPLKQDASCSPCESEHFSATKDANKCIAWTVTSCPPGSGYAAGSLSSDSACSPCTLGEYSSNNDKTPCRSTCDAGMYTGVNACVPCVPGTHNNLPNAKACSGTPCVAGTYGPAGSTLKADATCTPCAQGMYSSSGKAIASIHPSIHPTPSSARILFSKPFAAPSYMLAPLCSHSPHLSIRLTYSNSPLVRWTAPLLAPLLPFICRITLQPLPQQRRALLTR